MKANRALSDLSEAKVPPVLKAPLVIQVVLELKEILGLSDHPVQQVTQVLPAHWDFQVSRVQQVQKERKVQPEDKDHRDLKEPPVNQIFILF